MREHPVSEAPNYTNAVLVMGFVNLISALFTIWALYGFMPAVIAALAVNYLIERLPVRD